MRALALILLLAVAPSSSAGDEKTVLATGDWSKATNGLRGRLILAQGGTLGDSKARETLLYVELENVDRTASGAVSVHFDPDTLKCELTDGDGKAVPQTPVAGSGGRPGRTWVVIPFDSSIRLRANPFGFGRAEGLLVHLCTTNWHLKDAAEYHLSGTLTIAPPDGHGRTDAWKGALKLPPLEVRVPAPARPSVVDAKSGITVAVQEDGRTIVARNKDGKAAWAADVIKTADIPVGQSVVRALQLKDGKLTAVFGKHSFADFDPATGKFLRAGSD